MAAAIRSNLERIGKASTLKPLRQSIPVKKRGMGPRDRKMTRKQFGKESLRVRRRKKETDPSFGPAKIEAALERQIKCSVGGMCLASRYLGGLCKSTECPSSLHVMGQLGLIPHEYRRAGELARERMRNQEMISGVASDQAPARPAPTGDAPAADRADSAEDAGADADSQGGFELSQLRQHPLNPNCMDERALGDLVESIKKAGHPLTTIVFTRRSDGELIVLSGWHNAQACIRAGITRVDPKWVEEHPPMRFMDELYVLETRNRRGQLDKLKRAQLVEAVVELSDTQKNAAAELQMKPAEVSQHLARVKLADAVNGVNRELVGQIPRDAVNALRGLPGAVMDAAVVAVAQPATVATAAALRSAAVERWSDGPMTASEAKEVVAALADGADTEQALARVLGLPVAEDVDDSTPITQQPNPEDGTDPAPGDVVDQQVAREAEEALPTEQLDPEDVGGPSAGDPPGPPDESEAAGRSSGATDWSAVHENARTTGQNPPVGSPPQMGRTASEADEVVSNPDPAESPRDFSDSRDLHVHENGAGADEPMAAILNAAEFLHEDRYWEGADGDVEEMLYGLADLATWRAQQLGTDEAAGTPFDADEEE